MSTPEGVVKDRVKATLKEYGFVKAGDELKTPKAPVIGWYYMPVSNGMGVMAIADFVGCLKGQFFVIETKAPGKKPTKNQELRMQGVMNAGGKSFVIDGQDSLEYFLIWIKEVVCVG